MRPGERVHFLAPTMTVKNCGSDRPKRGGICSAGEKQATALAVQVANDSSQTRDGPDALLSGSDVATSSNFTTRMLNFLCILVCDVDDETSSAKKIVHTSGSCRAQCWS
uniref:Uncharacterized protein n=1 Tax=Haptolina brevifila TaxID=156173 RepID=A0A7S2N9P0_9EUKA|mmetsp:Transcript_70917/g.140592  ORF Transcript_70917/g.140592 Transcript_70917/m.140592 type:complete len:109 (+) Transcript_70917:231-557(+)